MVHRAGYGLALDGVFTISGGRVVTTTHSPVSVFFLSFSFPVFLGCLSFFTLSFLFPLFSLFSLYITLIIASYRSE